MYILLFSTFAAPVKCNQGMVDLFLLVDGSRSISSKNFKLVKKFLRRLTSEFDVSEKAAHVGLLQFSDEKSMSYEFALNEMHNNKDVRKAIRRMKYRAGVKTNTGNALRVVDQYVSCVYFNFDDKNWDCSRMTENDELLFLMSINSCQSIHQKISKPQHLQIYLLIQPVSLIFINGYEIKDAGYKS